ncbi:MAG: helix-turn-helix domain-containing protein [Pseudomonadota bacterium]
MAAKRHTPTEVQNKLQEAVKLIDCGVSLTKVCDQLGVSRSTLSRWLRKEVLRGPVSQDFDFRRSKIIYYPTRHDKRTKHLSMAEALGMSEDELKMRQEAVLRQKEANERRKRMLPRKSN